MDISVYMEAITQFFQNIVSYFRSLPVDEDYAWGAIGLGILLVLIGLIVL